MLRRGAGEWDDLFSFTADVTWVRAQAARRRARGVCGRPCARVCGRVLSRAVLCALRVCGCAVVRACVAVCVRSCAHALCCAVRLPRTRCTTSLRACIDGGAFTFHDHG